MTVEDHQTEMSSSETEGSVGPRLEERFRTLVEHIPGVATYLDRVLDDPAHSEPCTSAHRSRTCSATRSPNGWGRASCGYRSCTQTTATA